MEKNSNKGLKKLVLLLLLFVGLGASVTAGAYWASSFTAKNPTNAIGDLNVKIGQGKSHALETTLTLTAGNTGFPLVPQGYEDEGVTTYTRDITITATWAVVEEEDGEYTLESANGTLSGEVTGYSFKGTENQTLTPAEILAMFSFDVSENVAISFAGSSNIVVTVTFHTEPENQALYEIVANGTLTITVTLSVDAE